MRCHDCGVGRRGFHHLGCDMQQCAVCGMQMLSCGCRFDEDGPDDDDWASLFRSGSGDFFIDSNGCLTERIEIDGREVIVHYDDVPETDITTVDGIRCTTPLRTIIDLAADLGDLELERMVRDALDRGLFTVEDATERLAQPDIRNRTGALRLRKVLHL